MRRIPPIKAVMTPFPNSVSVDEPVGRAKELMVQQGIRHLPVMEKNTVVGVITDREVRLAIEGSEDAGGDSEPRIRDFCARETYVVDRAEPLDRVLFHMARNHLDSALVTKDGKLVGIFTMTDACRSFGELLRALFPPGGDDQVA